MWLHLFPIPGECVPAALRAQELGFDGVLLADSQNLVGDPFVELGAIARSTSGMGVGTGIVNPVTRHPAVVASAMATVHVESGGRAVLGLGRGDSSLAQLGIAAPKTEELRVFVTQVRGYLSGEQVAADGAVSRIGWIADIDLPPVPVEVAATGPRTIRMAGVHADRVMLTLGAEPGRIASAIATARDARAQAGLDPAQLRVGAYVNVACHDDLPTARSLVRGSTAIFAHFSAMSAAASAGLDVTEAATVARLGESYDEARHGLSDAAHIGALSDDFVDRFAVVGPPEVCVQRLRQLIDLGLDRVIVVAGSRDADKDVLAETNRRFAAEVLPALRQPAA